MNSLKNPPFLPEKEEFLGGNMANTGRKAAFLRRKGKKSLKNFPFLPEKEEIMGRKTVNTRKKIP